MPKPRGAGKSVVKSLSIDLKSAPLWTDTSYKRCNVMIRSQTPYKQAHNGKKPYIQQLYTSYS